MGMRKTLLVIFFLAVIPAGCGELDCRDIERGTFEVTYVETSGSCGALPNEIVEGRPGNETLPGHCVSAALVKSENNCRIEHTWACASASVGLATESTSIFEWGSEDDGTGSLQITVYDYDTGNFICLSTYDVGVERL